MKDINPRELEKQIKAYEPMITSLLKSYKINFDYEDIVQEMKTVLWKVLVDDNPETMWIEGASTKFSSFIYTAMENRLINILKVQYRIFLKPQKKIDRIDKETGEKIIDSETGEAIQDLLFDENGKPVRDELTDDEKGKRKLTNPAFIDDLSFEQKRTAVEEGVSAESIRLKLDLEFFEESLKDEELKLWQLKFKGSTVREIAQELEIPKTTVHRRLNKLDAKFKQFMDDGEI
jgi:RNA polymerase sigma factor (sigma-70 family)